MKQLTIHDIINEVNKDKMKELNDIEVIDHEEIKPNEKPH